MTQNDQILAHLRAGHTLTRVEAIITFRVFNLTARITELRDAGHDIRTRIKRDANGARYAEYWMPQPPTPFRPNVSMRAAA
jgi:hypothetical protein